MFFYLDSTAFQPAAFTSRIYCSFHFFCVDIIGNLYLDNAGFIAGFRNGQAFCLGIGQVMFQENLLTGLFFLAGIGVNSWTGTFYTALGTLLPVLFAVFWGIDPEMLNMGLMGYNGVLCALALGGKTWKSFVWALCSVLLSVVLQFAGIKLGITTLTAPFVLSVWMIMIMQKVVNTKGE